jgi:hypothetical protein
MIIDQKLLNWFRMSEKISRELSKFGTITKELAPPVKAFITNAERVDVFAWLLTAGQTLGVDLGWTVAAASAQFPRKRPSWEDRITEISKFHTDEQREGFNTLMSAQLVLAWTAFETLAGDLWEEAINFHPQTLATRASELLKDPATKGIQEPSLPILYLSEHDFNLEKKMGTAIRVHRGNPFQSLDSIANTYQTTFPKGWVNDQNFWKDTGVRSAFLLRNLIVHRAGVVDEEFRKKSKPYAKLQGFKVEERFYLDGELLSELVLSLLDFAHRLIQSVDKWIKANKSRRK